MGKEMKKKILVCGTTDFLMANFIRYLLYRTKEYEIISVDNLEDLNDTNRIYFNKNHKFYIGDITNQYFMERLITLEKPNYIVCGEVKYELLVNTAFNLVKFNIPIIMLLSLLNTDMNIAVKSVMKNYTTLSVPNTFGMRQKPGNNMAGIIKEYLFNKQTNVSNLSVPWVYAEDVASLIWYLIEKNIKGDIIMPLLGNMSEIEVVNKIEQLYQKKYPAYITNRLLVEKCISSNIDWVPDYNIEEALEKTIRWFDANRWALI